MTAVQLSLIRKQSPSLSLASALRLSGWLEGPRASATPPSFAVQPIAAAAGSPPRYVTRYILLLLRYHIVATAELLLLYHPQHDTVFTAEPIVATAV